MRILEKIMIQTLRNIWMEDDGQDLAEYGLLLALITVALVAGVLAFSGQITTAFSNATAALKN